MFAYQSDAFVKFRLGQELKHWKRPLLPTPDLVKQAVVKEYGQKFNLGTLVETGTYLGFMVSAVQNDFSKIISIELDPLLSRRAQNKFKPFKHISIFEGDSAEVLPWLLKGLSEPALFWLDGHYSGPGTASAVHSETPILEELESILNRNVAEDVILIDDAHDFNGSKGYPTVSELRSFIYSKAPHLDFKVEDSIIRVSCLPRG